MSGIIRALSWLFKWFVSAETTLNYRSSSGTTTASVFVPMPGSEKKKFGRFAAWKTRNGSVIEVKFGYYDRALKPQFDKPIFRKPPRVHFDTLDDTCPSVFNVTPSGFSVWILGSMNSPTATPKCTLYVQGESVLLSIHEKIWFWIFQPTIGTVICWSLYASLIKGNVPLDLPRYAIIEVCVAIGFAASVFEFRSRRSIKGELNQKLGTPVL